MTMRDLHNNISHVTGIVPQTLAQTASPEGLQSANIDLQFFSSAEVVAYLGDIDEMGTSPVGDAKVQMILEHADDDGSGSPDTFANVALADVLGPSAVSGGIVATTTTDNAFLEVGYTAGKRWLRATLVPTGLPNGGPAALWVVRGRPRHAPQ